MSAYVDLEDVARIRLSGAEESYALVDPADLPWLAKWTWSLQANGYAARFTSTNGRKIKIYMHRAILQPPDGLDVDHINRVRLDNRRANLRAATRRENCLNTGMRSDNKSGVRGVSWMAAQSKWVVRKSIDGRYVSLGAFDSIEDAAAAYEKAQR